MFRIKRLYRYMLQAFSMQLVATFLICLFILLMQFLWKYVDEMVGKGLGLDVLGEFFIYAALSLMPQAIPLAILLASLMTFGSMGEKLELLAIKAAGISMLRIMRPLFILVGLISLGSFVFQNKVIPVSQAKMYSLLLAIREKSPELQIPAGSFYKDIKNYTVYVREKNIETGLLKDMMIYDVSKGFDDMSIIVADSGYLNMTEDKLFLVVDLFNGSQFKNLERQSAGATNIPFYRDEFETKRIMIAFDSNFNRGDDGLFSNSYVGKNLGELQHTIDSIKVEVDSMQKADVKNVLFREERTYTVTDERKDILDKNQLYRGYNPDSVLAHMGSSERINMYERAVSRARQNKSEFNMRYEWSEDKSYVMRRHEIEWHKKFSLAMQCLIFFFIGAPLGAIIRKGGLGMPVVASVALFITYYIIDNMGYKMGKNGVWEVWQGAWLSASILAPLGAFLTYKANIDSTLFNVDVYINAFRKWFSIRDKNRTMVRKEISIHDTDYTLTTHLMYALNEECMKMIDEAKKRPGYVSFWLSKSPLLIETITEGVERVVEELKDSQDNLVLHKAVDYPVLSPEACNTPVIDRYLQWACMFLFPVGLAFYYRNIKIRKRLVVELQTIIRLNNELSNITQKYIKQ